LDSPCRDGRIRPSSERGERAFFAAPKWLDSVGKSARVTQVNNTTALRNKAEAVGDKENKIIK